MDIQLLAANYSYHSQPYHSPCNVQFNYLFRLQSEGNCLSMVDGKLAPVNPGDLLLYAPGQNYELKMEPQSDNMVRSGDYYIICRGVWLEQWWAKVRKPNRLRVAVEDPNDPILFLWRQLVLENRRREEQTTELAVSLLRSICHYIDRSVIEGGAVLKDLFVANAMKRYIEHHATEAFRSEDVARHVRLSVSRASHLFKESFGESFFQYALRVRLSIAKEKMLYSSMTLEQIAESSGLSSYAFFHHKFKESFGMSPGEFRRKHPG
ncbi:MAG: AraC family transcriptional regulator [Paenibacillaceae bacterium]|jgi:AraC family transcriptional regulator of arabinose operon|nr:AraC family transcriptional regulator [Paenibacillaceae bacterium]